MNKPGIGAWSVLFLSIFLGSLGQICLKQAVNLTKGNGIVFYFELFKNIWLYFGVIAYGLSFIVWIASMRIWDISFIRPLTSLGYIATYAGAIVILGEDFSPRRLLGIVIITIGVIFIR